MMKFEGPLSKLKRLLSRHDVVGSWERKTNGVYLLRCPDRGILGWAEGSKSLWFQGPPDVKRALELKVARLLSRRTQG